MTEFEDRLRAAMASVAGPPPAGLLDGIRRRHRRHVRRVTTACVAVVAFGLAGTLVSRGVLASPGGGPPAPAGPAATGQVTGPASTVPASTVPASTVPSASASPATAAPGTVLRDCESANPGTLSPDWKAQSVHAGPVWFIYARPGSIRSPGHPPASGNVRVSAMIIAVSNAHTAVVTGIPGLGGRLRFLANVSAGQRASLAQGAAGLTLAGCPAAAPGVARVPAAYAPGLTMFWEGYVTDLRGCLPLQVRAMPAGPPVRVTVAPAGGSCAG
jgi:hypothetical protein